MAEVPRTQTPVDLDGDVRDRLRASFSDANLIARLLAFLAIEHRGGRNVFNHNLGNLTSDESGRFWRPPWFEAPTPETTELNRRRHEQMLAGKAPRAFRAHDNLTEGTQDLVSLLQRRFPTMLEAKGDRAFLRAWRDSGYTPGLDVAATLPGFSSLRRKFGGSDDRKTSAGATVLVVGGGLGLLWWALR